MKTYTAVVLFPDDLADNYGDLCVIHFNANSEENLISTIKHIATSITEYDGDPDNFLPIFLCEGYVNNLIEETYH